MTLRTIAWIELAVCWIAWFYPYLFRAPHSQKRKSVTVAAPTRVGLLLQAASAELAFFPAPGTVVCR